MTDTQLYRQHLATLDQYLQRALEIAASSGCELEGVLLHAGRPGHFHADDRETIFRPAPHFQRWLPLAGPEHLLLVRPGRRPRVARVRPRDYWYDTSPPTVSFWEEAVELLEVESYDSAVTALGDLGHVAYLGNSPAAAALAGVPEERVEPAELMAPLDWYRAYKTDYEVAFCRLAAQRAAAGHDAGRRCFQAGSSNEREIYRAYLEGCDQLESELPFDSIIAADDRSAILHYQHKRGAEFTGARVLLVDAGASANGWAADVTRTWVREGAEPEFVALVEGLDAIEQKLVQQVSPGKPYLEIHLDAHRRIGGLLAEVGVLRCDVEQAVGQGLTSAFFPHGVGHQLGLQVHDVGGHQAGPDGGSVPPPAAHSYLRNTRLIEPGHYLTVEPGIYFIPMLLDPLRQGPTAGLIDWQLVDRLVPMGGIRIEDDVLCTGDGPEDLTRPLLPGPRGC